MDKLEQAQRRHAYWRKRIHNEDRQQGLVPSAPRYRVIRRFQTAEKIFDIGCGVTLSDLGSNFRAFLNAEPPYVELVTDGTPLREPRDRPPPPAPPKPRAAVELVDDEDVVTAWRKTLALMTERCDGNRGLAEDLLMADVRGRDLYKRAVATACAKEAQRVGHSVSPTSLGL